MSERQDPREVGGLLGERAEPSATEGLPISPVQRSTGLGVSSSDGKINITGSPAGSTGLETGRDRSTGVLSRAALKRGEATVQQQRH